MTGPVPGIAVVGAAGGVGRAAIQHLAAWLIGPLRLGARRPSTVDPAVAGVAADGRVAHVDIADAASLAGFCASAGVVVNCAGPSRAIGDRVARAALSAGADYVDAAGGDRLGKLVAQLTRGTSRCAVVSAGMMPGLTGLLPRFLAATMSDAPRWLAGHVGGRDRFTPAGVADYLCSDGFGAPLAAWRDDRLVACPPAADHPTEVPFFPEPVLSLPYLSTETARMAAALGLRDVRWHLVFVDGQVAAWLRRPEARRSPHAATDLCRAADLDLFGRAPYQLVVVTAGAAGGATRTVALGGRSATELTGAITALSAARVREGAVPPGTHHAAEVLDPVAAVAALRTADAVTRIVDVGGPALTTGSYQEGTL